MTGRVSSIPAPTYDELMAKWQTTQFFVQQLKSESEIKRVSCTPNCTPLVDSDVNGRNSICGRRTFTRAGRTSALPAKPVQGERASIPPVEVAVSVNSQSIAEAADVVKTLTLSFPNLNALTHKELDVLLVKYGVPNTETMRKEPKANYLKNVVYNGDGVKAIKDLVQHSLLHVMRCDELDELVKRLDQQYEEKTEIPRSKCDKIQLVERLILSY
eukprot:PhF_6_TR4172/c0_g1_i2/m.5607